MQFRYLKVLFWAFLGILFGTSVSPQQKTPLTTSGSTDYFAKYVRPVLTRYCLGCHSTQAKKGGLDLSRFTTIEAMRRELKPWQSVVTHLEVGDMPPFGSPQPSDTAKKSLISWISGIIADEAQAQAGDPGFVPMRRLSHTEYNKTIRELTGVDLQPTREFPAEGAAGEGFTNAAEGLSDISPTLLAKYFSAAKDIASHVVLLPDEFRFSASKNRRDWTDESTARLRKFYASFTDNEGRLAFAPYLLATVRYRSALQSGKSTTEQVAKQEKLNAKYLSILWRTLTDPAPRFPLSVVSAHWRQAKEQDVPALVEEITAWQNRLWRTVRVGSYIHPEGKGYAVSLARQLDNDVPSASVQPLRVHYKPLPGQTEVSLSLGVQELLSPNAGQVIWHNPRFEAPNKPTLLLRDYAQFGSAYEVNFAQAFAKTAQYLSAVQQMAYNPNLSLESAAKKYGLESDFLHQWDLLLALEPLTSEQGNSSPLRVAPAVRLTLLEEPVAKDGGRAAINGWRKKGSDLPVVLSNSSDTTEHIPGTAAPHSVVVHPTPNEFVGVMWRSPITGRVHIHAKIHHVHPSCGNGVAWRLAHLHSGQEADLDEGTLELGGEAHPTDKIRNVERGDTILLAVDAKNNDHSCDLTDVALTITLAEESRQKWDLAHDTGSDILVGNPHPDTFGGSAVWSFVRGASFSSPANTKPIIPPGSVLARWRVAAANPARTAEADVLAMQVQHLLTGSQPAAEQQDDRALYEALKTVTSPLFDGVNLGNLQQPSHRPPDKFGVPKERFGARGEEASLLSTSNTTQELRLPAALFRDREFVVEGELIGNVESRAATFYIGGVPPALGSTTGNVNALVVAPNSPASNSILKGYADFRNCFPLFLCFPAVIPNDEVVSLKMFHREDEPLRNLFLDDAETAHLEHLWKEHRFISRQPIAENTYLPLFIGFVTQDQPKEMLTFFEGQRPVFKARADAFLKDEENAIPKQMEALLEFAFRAYRRPLQAKEKAELFTLYHNIRAKGASHEEAFQGTLARVLVSPAFLFRAEVAPAGKTPGAINDWELATRLSYFLWASSPDPDLRRIASQGILKKPAILAAQTRRMLADSRVRALAEEFGAQWLHVRGFDTLNEKNERLFPTFNPELRKAIYEETLLFFQDLFQSNRPVTRILDADYTFLNETLAKHYGIPNVTGAEWRRVDGVHKYGRGGILGLASVQTKESGASRTSPVLRGNWVVETLLGERLPRPPANVPRLPEEETAVGLTVRQQVEQHARIPSCASCHRRIDPYGFALERYDPIGRIRETDFGGKVIDSRAKLRNGVEFEGMEGLRNYLLTQKKDIVIRLFCRRLLGYALGRAVVPSDQPLIEQMIHALNQNQGHITSAVLTIVNSPQFRTIRGQDFVEGRDTPRKNPQLPRILQRKTGVSSG